MSPVFVLAIATLLTSTGTVPPAARPDAQVLAAFHQRIGEYVEIHRMAAAGLGDPVLCGDSEELSRQSAALAAAIREARPLADEGNIFTAAIGAMFRARIATAVRAATLTPAAPEILRVLPDLPLELEYQLDGRHLLLVDVSAGLVVDVLRYALPAPRLPRDIGPADACIVHPDLPVCWM